MNWQEAETHRRVSAAGMASEASRLAREPPPSPFHNTRCPQCGQTAGGHYELTSLLRTGWLEARIGEGRRLFCSRECVYRWNKRAAPLQQPEAIPVEIIVAPQSLTSSERAAQIATTRAVTASCCRCGHRLRIDQTQNPDGTWSPDPPKLLAAAGWTRSPTGDLYCGAGCAKTAANVAAAEAARPVPVPVTTLPDVSYQRTRHGQNETTPAAPPIVGPALTKAKGGR